MKNPTKDRILETAHSLFEEKGFNGVTMREISTQSGVNKGLLHYYFKSKQAIFLGVFKTVIKLVFINISAILENDEINFETKISRIVDSYFTLFSKHPRLPLFVLSELGKLPEFAESTNFGSSLNRISQRLEENMREFKEVKPGDGFQLLLSIVSLCAFPFMASPILKVVGPPNVNNHNKFLKTRKTYIKNVLKNAYS